MRKREGVEMAGEAVGSGTRMERRSTPPTFGGKRIKDMTLEEYRQAVQDSGSISNCVIGDFIALFSGKWHIQVLFELTRRDTARFGELRRAIPDITSTMLTSTLRDLEAAGVVERTQFDEALPHVEYRLNERGDALLPVFYEMAKWCDAG